MKKSLAVWSPRPDAKGRVLLSDKVAIYGLPAITITARVLEQDDIAWVKNADTCLFVSHNAVSQLLSQLPTDSLRQQQHIAIGKRTAAALHAHELTVSSVANPPFTSEALLATPEFQALTIRQLALCCGVGGRTVLQKTLTEQGITVKRIECYQRNKAKLTAQNMVEFTRERQINAVLLSSCGIADAVVESLSQACIAFQSWTVFAFSERIAEYAQSLGFSDVIVVPTTNQQLLNQAILDSGR